MKCMNTGENKMKHLFIARHGHYGSDDLINQHGINQMERIGAQIQNILSGNLAYIISSTAPRALGSSHVLSQILTGQERFFQEPYLWSGTDAPKESYYRDHDKDKLMSIVNQYRDKAEGLVLVSHLEVVEDFPEYFFKKEFGKSIYLPEISKGEAIHIDLEKQVHQILR